MVRVWTSGDPGRDRAHKVLDKAATARLADEARRRETAQAADLASGRKVAWPSRPDLRAS